MTRPGNFPHFNVHSTAFDPLPEFGGSKAVLHHSADGRRLAGSFRESGTHRVTMPFEEFIYIVGGGAPVTLGTGDCCYLRQGQDVLFEMTDDFHDVTVLISDDPIAL